MARSAREIIDDHIAGGQAKLVAYRKQYEGSGQYVAPTKFNERDERLLQSLLCLRDVAENAMYGIDDARFRHALDCWVALEWGGYFDRSTFTMKTALTRKQPELIRGHNA